MALQGLFSSFLVTAPPRSFLPLPKPNLPKRSAGTKPVQCNAATTKLDHDQEVNRRNANYAPSLWDYNSVKSLSSDFTEEKYASEIDELKDEVKGLIHEETDMQLAKLELIEAVQRLGLNFHFQKDIKAEIDAIYSNRDPHVWLSGDLYSTALRFRLLREHGYDVSQEVFRRFMDETGNFKANLCEDAKGILSLYEASFFGFEGENIIDDAKTFTTKHLKNMVKGYISPHMVGEVNHALGMPLRWTLPRVEARWFIDNYEQKQNMNSTLLKLAKLDYNIVQSFHQKEVSKLSEWWVNLGLNKMDFARDRLVEHFYWSVGMVSQPQYSDFRDMLTRVTCLITTIDDVYDVYGSIEELELFTDYVDRWDITEVDKLPINIRIILLALFNTTNEIGYSILRERGFNIIPYLSKQWANLCKTYHTEAKWFYSGYKPTLEEYLNNAVVSIAAPLMLFTAYMSTEENINVETLNYMENLPSIMWCSSMVLRLVNDLGTSSDELARGDNLKAVQCYMNDTGATIEVARKYIDDMVHQIWKTMNKEMVHGSHPFSEPFVSANPNLARTAQFYYQFGDGHGAPDQRIKDQFNLILMEPCTLN